MDTALPQKFLFILDRNLAKANCTEDRVCTSCDIVVLDWGLYFQYISLLSVTLFIYALIYLLYKEALSHLQLIEYFFKCLC